jgi:hypothetical protein
MQFVNKTSVKNELMKHVLRIVLFYIYLEYN